MLEGDYVCYLIRGILTARYNSPTCLGGDDFPGVGRASVDSHMTWPMRQDVT
jgi:hypothetical protein